MTEVHEQENSTTPVKDVVQQVLSSLPTKVSTTESGKFMQLRQRLRPIEFHGLPKRLKGKSLENLVGYESQKLIAIAAIKNGDSIFLSGPCGSGKSHFAYSLFAVWLEAHRKDVGEFSLEARFLPAVEFFHELRSTFGDHTEASEDQVMNQYGRDDLLLIDDVGAEKVSDWSRQMFYLLVDRRYRNCQQTIITSNLSLKQLSTAIDDRIASRIAEMGPVIELDGEDWRVTHAH